MTRLQRCVAAEPGVLLARARGTANVQIRRPPPSVRREPRPPLFLAAGVPVRKYETPKYPRLSKRIVLAVPLPGAYAGAEKETLPISFVFRRGKTDDHHAGQPAALLRRLTRRETLKAGALSALAGFTLPKLAPGRGGASPDAQPGRAKSVILLYLLGGAATQD